MLMLDEKPLGFTPDALNVLFEDNKSKLGADNVQGAIDKVVENLSSLNTKLTKLIDGTTPKKLPNGLSAIKVPAGTQIQQVTMLNNMRGIASNDNGVVVAYISDYSGNDTYVITATASDTTWGYVAKISMRTMQNVKCIYNSSNSLFVPETIPNFTSQVVLNGRNNRTGAIYALWYDASVKAFRIASTISGAAPNNGDYCYLMFW